MGSIEEILSGASSDVRELNKKLFVPKRRTKKPKRAKVDAVPTEFDEQSRFIRWCSANADQHPPLAWVFAVPNGGKRSRWSAGRAVGEGMKSGVPDVFLPHPNGVYAGLWLEFKRVKGGKVSASQKQWIDHLNEVGYLAVVARGCDNAISIVEKYLGIGDYAKV